MSHIGLALGCVTVAFVLGIKSAGEYESIGMTNAEGSAIAGDFNADSRVSIEDAITALEIAQGYATPTIDQLKADMNGDFVITVDDALAILRSLNAQ